MCACGGTPILTSRAAFANCLRLLLSCKCLRLMLVSVEEKDGAWEGASWVPPSSMDGSCLEYSVKSSIERGGE